MYEGTVVRIADYGFFANILPGKDGLVHISQISDERIEDVSQMVQVGEKVMVKVLGIDRMGRIKLSMKEANRPEGESSSRMDSEKDSEEGNSAELPSDEDDSGY